MTVENDSTEGIAEDLRAIARETKVPSNFMVEVNRKLRESQHSRPVRSRLFLVSSLMIPAALAAGLVLLPASRGFLFGTSEEREYGVRGASGEAHVPVAFRLYELRPNGQPSLAYESIAQSSPVMFAYSNPVSTGFEWVSIIAVDSEGVFHRLMPTADSGDIASIAAKNSDGFVSIPTALTPGFAIGAVDVFAVFSARELSVYKLRDWVSRGTDDLVLEDGRSAVRLLTLSVEP
ncbi:MAG: hypothetical protein AAFQ82_17180 [Myxococcota bacterium]